MARQANTDPAWHNLGALLTDRRVQLAPRYRNRRVFCEEKNLDYRVVSDIESARRSNFSAPMLTAIEVAYEIAEGGIRKAIEDPDLEKLPERGKGRAVVGPVAPHIDRERDDVYIPPRVPFKDLFPWEQAIWAAPGLSVEEREAAVYFLHLVRGDLVGEGDTLTALLATLRAIIPEGDPALASGERR
jgi:hypothetical protein